FASDSKTLFTSGVDRFARRWDVATGAELQRYDFGMNAPAYLTLAPDGKTLALASVASPMRLFDVESGMLLSPTGGHRQQLWESLFIADGRSIFTSAVDGTWRFWDATTGREEQCIEHRNDWAVGLRLAHDGRTGFASSSYLPGAIAVWDLDSRKRIRSLPFESDGKRPIIVLAVSPKDDLLAIGDFQIDKTALHLVDSLSGKRIRSFEYAGTRPHGATFTPDGKTVAVWCGCNTLQLWDVASGVKVRQFWPLGEPQLRDGIPPVRMPGGLGSMYTAAV